MVKEDSLTYRRHQELRPFLQQLQSGGEGNNVKEAKEYKIHICFSADHITISKIWCRTYFVVFLSDSSNINSNFDSFFLIIILTFNQFEKDH